MRKVVSGITSTVLLIGILTLAFNIQPVKAQSRTITVPDEYPTIQEAISNANHGDTVFVKNGTYYENVIVNKRVALFGENKNTTVIVGVAYSPVWESVVSVRANDVKIANFTVTNGGHGIYLGGRRSIVTDCVAYGNGFGLTISSSSQNFLRRNILFDNSHNLLVLGFWSIDDFIQDIDPSNYVDGKPIYYLVNEENLSINPVTFPNVGYLAVVNSTSVQIANLSLSRNGDGLLIAFSPNTLIENVEATHNSYGISLKCSPRTTVKHCNFSYNDRGIFLYYSDHVNIQENNISHNEGGISLMCSNYCLINHNNLIKNYRYYQARVHDSHSCHWDDGYFCGGNYWSDHVCTGNPSDGSQPYIIDENNIDHYPYQNPNSWVMRPRIYIEADGSVDPDTAPISSVDNVTYTFTDNIYGEIIVERDNTVVDGASYTVQGVGAYDSTGIALFGRSNVTIKNTEIKSFVDGIRIYRSSNNTISGNNITENDRESIWLDFSHNNAISGNSITNNGDGILLGLSDNNSMSANNITANNEHSISLFESSNNTINGNNITANKRHGIYLWHYSSHNSISGNNITNNKIGIYLSDSSNDNIMSGNNITANNDYGIFLGYSSDNSISGNNITNNSYGVLFHNSSNNTICHNNLVDNSEQVHSYSSANVWDDGYPSGGNYWSDHFCTGNPSDGTQPYIIDETNIDYYPFQDPSGWLLPPPSLGYPLTIYSEPTEITFTADNISHTTPWSRTYGEDASVSLVMPSTYVVGKARYNWSRWSDGVANQSRIATMNTSVTLTAYYARVNYELTVTSSPITGITFTIDGTPETTPNTKWLLEGSYTLEMPETHDGYVWSHWLEDGDPNRTKTITLPGTTWTGVFAFAVQPHGPEAEFTATPDTALAGDSIKFDASASLSGWNGTHEMPITEYRWDFGGAIKIKTSIPILYYNFISPGICNTTLTVYAPGATPETDTTSREVKIISVPIGGYSLPLKTYTTTKPLTLYLAIATVGFTMIKRKMDRRTKRALRSRKELLVLV